MYVFYPLKNFNYNIRFRKLLYKQCSNTCAAAVDLTIHFHILAERPALKILFALVAIETKDHRTQRPRFPREAVSTPSVSPRIYPPIVLFRTKGLSRAMILFLFETVSNSRMQVYSLMYTVISFIVLFDD